MPMLSIFNKSLSQHRQGIAAAQCSLVPVRRLALRPFAFHMTSLRRNQYISTRGLPWTEPDRTTGWRLPKVLQHGIRVKRSFPPSELTGKYDGRGTSHEAQDRRPRRAYVGEVLFVRHGCLCFFVCGCFCLAKRPSRDQPPAGWSR